MPIAPPAPTPLDADAALRLEGEIAALDALDLPTLRTRWRQHLRTAPPPLARPLLLRLLAYRIQAKQYGELDRAGQSGEQLDHDPWRCLGAMRHPMAHP